MLQNFLMVLIKHLTRSNMDKSGPGPVFAQPKVGPVQFSLSKKWTRSSFRSAKSGPGPVFAQPKVDPVRVEFSETKVSTIVKLAWLHAQIAFSR